jgi:hypothetical protein
MDSQNSICLVDSLRNRTDLIQQSEHGGFDSDKNFRTDTYLCTTSIPNSESLLQEHQSNRRECPRRKLSWLIFKQDVGKYASLLEVLWQ